MAYDDQDVLAVLAGQSPGYLIHPDASAFVAEGLDDPAEVEAALLRLVAAGHALEQEDVAHEPVYEPVMVPKLKDGEPVMRKGEPVLEPMTGPEDELPVLAVKTDAAGRMVTQPVLDEKGAEVIIRHGFEVTEKGAKRAKREET